MWQVKQHKNHIQYSYNKKICTVFSTVTQPVLPSYKSLDPYKLVKSVLFILSSIKNYNSSRVLWSDKHHSWSLNIQSGRQSS